MKMYKHIFHYLLISTLWCLLSISCADLPTTQVKYSGALRTMMSGNLEATISLDTLLSADEAGSRKKHLYALGATENLKGEIQIFDSEPTNSVVIDSSLQINDSYAMKAALLVYAEVEKWEEFTIENITTKEDLEKRIFETATSHGVNVDQPFPFLLEGQVATLDWHVIDWKEGDTIHNHKKHIESGLNGTLKDKEVTIIGFYSTKHKAVFTHHTTNMHLHFKTNDEKIAGHIDDLILEKKILLKLPK